MPKRLDHDPPKPGATAVQARGRAALFQRFPWLPLVLPFLVFMAVGSLEPTPKAPGGALIGLNIPYSAYPLVYTVKIALSIAALAFAWPAYRQLPFGLTLLALLLGILGGVLWVELAELGLERQYLAPLGLGKLLDLGVRSAFSPLEQLAAHPFWAWGFLLVRFVGLVAVVPLAEEFLLRGFLMRFVMQPDWWRVPFGKVSTTAVVVGTLFPMLMHPAELLAAAVWFSMITWLMVRTRSIWDCVAAHALTNLVLGIYVVASGGEAWRLM